MSEALQNRNDLSDEEQKVLSECLELSRDCLKALKSSPFCGRKLRLTRALITANNSLARLDLSP